MNRIAAKGKVVNDSEVEIRFVGKNLTLVGGIKLFRKFTQKSRRGRGIGVRH